MYTCVLCGFEERKEWNGLESWQLEAILQDLGIAGLELSDSAILDICDYCVAKHRIYLSDYLKKLISQ